MGPSKCITDVLLWVIDALSSAVTTCTATFTNLGSVKSLAKNAAAKYEVARQFREKHNAR